MWHNALEPLSRNFAFGGQKLEKTNSKNFEMVSLGGSVKRYLLHQFRRYSFGSYSMSHTASESTRLVWQYIREFFSKFWFGASWGPCQLFILTKFKKSKKLTKCFKIIFYVNSNTFKDFDAIFNSVASKENKLAHFQFKS
jgi:hypothetical protein